MANAPDDSPIRRARRLVNSPAGVLENLRAGPRPRRPWAERWTYGVDDGNNPSRSNSWVARDHRSVPPSVLRGRRRGQRGPRPRLPTRRNGPRAVPLSWDAYPGATDRAWPQQTKVAIAEPTCRTSQPRRPRRSLHRSPADFTDRVATAGPRDPWAAPGGASVSRQRRPRRSSASGWSRSLSPGRLRTLRHLRARATHPDQRARTPWTTWSPARSTSTSKRAPRPGHPRSHRAIRMTGTDYVAGSWPTPRPTTALGCPSSGHGGRPSQRWAVAHREGSEGSQPETRRATPAIDPDALCAAAAPIEAG